MKTFSRILVLFSLIACITACSKKETDVDPTLSSRIAGDYKVSYLVENEKTYTLNSSTTGTMKVIAESDNTVQVTLNVTNGNAAEDIKGTFKGVVLRDIGKGEVEMTAAGFKLGKGGNNQLSVKIAPVDGSTPYEFIGTK